MHQLVQYHDTTMVQSHGSTMVRAILLVPYTNGKRGAMLYLVLGLLLLSLVAADPQNSDEIAHCRRLVSEEDARETTTHRHRWYRGDGWPADPYK
ncbi:hypothetical protein CDAR_597771 [Caerostris darwini]|uniref:Uncharacterized protein n=1 Tax=Caerostris darwini TaxID=1538125 RepID=A0AAV4UEY9_9ARAC|nr:hypothetical protein CDAR_597771 [Caerostris darwini]